MVPLGSDQMGRVIRMEPHDQSAGGLVSTERETAQGSDAARGPLPEPEPHLHVQPPNQKPK